MDEYTSAVIDIAGTNSSLFGPLTDDTADRLAALARRLGTNEAGFNLTAITGAHDIALKHICDSLTAAPYIPQGARLLDVGSGAGFPALPLAIFRPDLRVTALDSTAKKVGYIRETAALLGIVNAGAVCGRGEDLAHDRLYRECFDAVCARAVGQLAILAEICLPLVKPGGVFIAMKGPDAAAELRAAGNIIRLTGGDRPHVIPLELRDTTGEINARTLVVITKAEPTPSDYPREYKTILRAAGK